MNTPNAIEFFGNQVMLVDPRAQGFGLEGHESLDPYANKFYILSGAGGAFVSPSKVPESLRAYYTGLGIDIAPSDRTVVLEADGAPVRERLQHDPAVASLLEDFRGSSVIPYMLTPEVAALADEHGLSILGDPEAVDYMGDKANFQQELERLGDVILSQSGFEVGIPHRLLAAGDRSMAGEAFDDLSQGGREDVVVIKPKSASALGLFVVDAEQGVAGVERVVRDNFSEDERVLLEAFVPHTHAPSMQGFGIRGGDYGHMYFGRQIISQQDGRFNYDAHEIPFGPPRVAVDPSSLDTIASMHEVLGTEFLDQKIEGAAGVDAVISLEPNGRVGSCKLTEVNVHIPGSLATYAAMCKLFPDGFTGVAYNAKIPLVRGQTPDNFLAKHGEGVIGAKGEYGMFPLNMSYPDAVDVILFARDSRQLESFQRAIHA
jgi:hypothetical protein